MTQSTEHDDVDQELAAIAIIIKALSGLDHQQKINVFEYIGRRFQFQKINSQIETPNLQLNSQTGELPNAEKVSVGNDNNEGSEDGISPIAQKWLSRNGLNSKGMSSLFSLGFDEIDLVAKEIPAINLKDKMRMVMLLKGIAGYLGSGTSRISDNDLRETCRHYSAYDSKNFATYIKDFSSEISGTKETGYSLTPRGMTAATEIIKQILGLDQEK